MKNTPREAREKLIIQWYEKKLNRDELLRVLEGSEILNKEDREKIKSEIIKNFYENFEKAKGDEGFKSADAEYRDIKKTKINLKKKSAELVQKKEESDSKLQEIDSQMLDIAETAMKLENGSWWKKWKLGNANERRDELEAQQKRIKREIGKLKEEKTKLQSLLKEKEEKYGPKVERTIKKSKKIELSETVQESLKKQTTLKGYREKYFQIIQDREEYMKNLLSEIESMDLGISEEKKKEVLEQIKVNLQQEIDSMKGGDEILKMADETGKWLEDNWEEMMKKLLDLKGKIREKENEIEEFKSKEKGVRTDEILQIREKQFELKKEQLELKKQYVAIKGKIDEKLKQYEGKGMDGASELRVESRKDRNERFEREGKINEMRKKYRLEIDTFKTESQKSWRKDVESYPHGRLYSFSELDRAAVEQGDDVGLVVLFDCSMDRDYTNSHSDPEYSAVVCVKVGDYEDYEKFVRRHATDADLDNKSLAYREITDVKLDGDILQVWLSKGGGSPSRRYDFKIKK